MLKKGRILLIGGVTIVIIAAAVYFFLHAGKTNPVEADGKMVYTSLGDSIAAGYGLAGFAEGVLPTESFSARFAARLSADTVYPLAVSGADSADVLAILETTAGQDAVRESDVITLAVGSNDVMGPGLDLVYKAAGVQNAAELAADINSVKDDYIMLLDLLSRLSDSVKTADGSAVLAACNDRFESNFSAIIDRLYQLNPYAQIYVIGYYNPFADFVFGSAVDFGATVQELTDGMNDFVSGHADCGNKFYYVAPDGLNPAKTNVILDLSGHNIQIDPHPNAAGHALIYEKLAAAYTEQNKK